MKSWALLGVLLVLRAAAQEAPKTGVVAQDDPAVPEARDILRTDPAHADALAERLLNSRLAAVFSPSKDPVERRAAIKAWISDEPDSAARISLGLARDDKNGNTLFEDSLILQAKTYYAESQNIHKSVFGRLRKTAKDSNLLKKRAEEPDDDDRREILRALFEGQGAKTSGKVDREGGGAGPAPKTAPGSAVSFSGYYDRLSASNLRGYSPQLLSLQSELNARRPPGAPRLIETGTLDYATLSYPGHGLRYGLLNLEERLRRERAIQLARLAGRVLTAGDLTDPGLEAGLSAQIPEEKLPPRLKRRRALLDKARRTIEDFDKTAAKSKRPDAVTRELLAGLSLRQKEASRWIAVAALEEELSQLEAEENFLTPELAAAIDAVPAPEENRRLYKKRGAELKSRCEQAKDNALKAQKLLESPSWASSLAEVDRLVARNQSLRRNLSRNTEIFSRVPWRIKESSFPRRPRWREILDDLALRWAPGTAFARAAAHRREGRGPYLETFLQVAAGELDAAARSFSLAEPTGQILRRGP